MWFVKGENVESICAGERRYITSSVELCLSLVSKLRYGPQQQSLNVEHVDFESAIPLYQLSVGSI